MPLKRSSPGPSGSSSNTKRTRFASPSEAATNGVDADLLEEDLPEGGGKESKKRAKEDAGGYNSDSSDDGEGVVPNRAKKDEADEDEDMFALSDDDAKADKGKSKGKEKAKEGDEVMTLDDVEGQEMASGDVDDDNNSDSEDEEMRAELAKGLDGPMGYEMTGFNMKRELEEGTMTKDGETFTENVKDPGDAQDVWLDGMEKDEIKKARRGKRERERLEREREERERGGGEEGAKQRKEKEEEMFRQAVALMERGETILEALQRLGIEVEQERKKKEKEQGKRKLTWAEKQKERKALLASGSDETCVHHMRFDTQLTENRDPAHPHSNPFTHLSEIVSAMTAIGHLDVYSLTRESIQRMLPASTAAPAPAFDERKFQYRFSKDYLATLPAEQRPVEREIFGGFISSTTCCHLTPLQDLSHYKVL